MKIDAKQIVEGGFILTEEFAPGALELDTDLISFNGPLQARAEVFRITNALTVRLFLNGKAKVVCGRCLKEFSIKIEKNTSLNFPANLSEKTIELDSQIREEIILDYPINPLCSAQCKGLCPRCGADLNQGNCSCKV